MMGSANKIAKGFVWTTAVNVTKALYGFVSVPVLIACFGKSDYGLIGLAMSINVYLRLMDIGLNSTNVRFFSDWMAKGENGKVGRLFGTSLSIYTFIGLLNAVIVLLVGFFSASIFNLEPQQASVMNNLCLILALSSVINWFVSCFEQFIRAGEHVGWMQKITMIPVLAQFLFLGLTVLAGLSIETYFLLTALSMVLAIPFCISKIRAMCPFISFRPRFDRQTVRQILPYFASIFSFGIFQFSMNYLRPVFLGMNGTVESVADYRILNGIVSIAVMIGSSFLAILLPSSSKAVSLDDRAAQDRIAYSGTKFVSVVICFCCFGLVSISRELLDLYVGEQNAYLLPWLVAWLAIMSLTHNQAISSLILSRTDIRAISVMTAISSVTGLCLCWFLIPVFGVGATVIAYGIYLVLQLSFYYFYYWPKVMKIDSAKVFVSSFAPYLVSGAAAAAAAFFLELPLDSRWLCLLVKGAVFAVIFVPAVTFFMGRSDKQLLRSSLRNETVGDASDLS